MKLQLEKNYTFDLLIITSMSDECLNFYGNNIPLYKSLIPTVFSNLIQPCFHGIIRCSFAVT